MNIKKGNAPMKKNLAALTMVMGLAALSLTVPAQSAQDCTDQLLATCTSCHYQNRICEKLDKKSRRDWQVSIKRMLRYGLVLDEAGQGKILECLAALKKDHTKLCR